ncbi:MAG: pentapeptide repeat-containing protein [Cyanobacteria bacterium J06560_6]
MAVLRGFGDWLRGGLKLPWGELAKQTINATKATADLSETWQKTAPKLAALKDLDRLDSFFKVFDSPVGKLAVSGLPFASLGIDLLKLYLDVTKTEPTLESSVALAVQMAYLESLAAVLERADEGTKARLLSVKLVAVFERQLEKAETVSLSKTRAKRTLTQLRNSELVEVFDEALGELLNEAGLKGWQVRVLVDQAAWGMPKYFYGVVPELKEAMEPLAEFLRSDGLRIEEKFVSVEEYLKEKIEPLPRQKVFDEKVVSFGNLYVPLMVQSLDVSGKETNERPIGIHAWAEKLLEQAEPRQVGFIEGEAGRGKSVFCRMFAAAVHLDLYPTFIPILIRLRDVRQLENNLTQTLETHLQDLDFVTSDKGWLTDENTRFLLIFDGFDELLLQGRESGGLKELIQQLGDFQRNSHHQCLVTGRPLALQGVDRMLSQTKNLQRVRLELMGDAQREEWLSNWAKLFGPEEAEAFGQFLTVCPKDISDKLACEPLLLYLLGRLHREEQLNMQMFADARGMQAKVRVYDEALKWVLERQRQDLNERVSGLDTEDLRQVLREAALCVMQSGNETARLTMLKERFTDSMNPAAELLKQAKRETGKTEDKALNNLLTAFYLRPGEGDRTGSVEFAHKSFGEFLFAERLQVAFEDWTELDMRGRSRMSEADVARRVYDLLGYGALTAEVVEYLKEKLFSSVSSVDSLVPLFQRLEQFYDDWCEGNFVDSAPSENWPQIKMMQLKAVEIDTGLRPVDIYAGINVLLLLFVLHGFGQQQVKADDKSPLHFHPCGDPDSNAMDGEKLLRMIGYSQLIRLDYFTSVFGHHLRNADLRSVDFRNADLRTVDFGSVDLSNADLRNANLRSAHLSNANLRSAYLSNADFRNANLSYASLHYADLGYANLRSVDLSSADLVYTDLGYADLVYTDLSSANLSNADLRNANLRNADLSYTNLSYTDFRNANLHSADLRNANLSYTDFRNANLHSAYLRNANLRNANLSYTDFRNGNLSYTDLGYTDLGYADLVYTDLRYVDLVYTDLGYADLGYANLRSANLRYADLRYADFRHANLSGIHFNENTNWENVRGLETAQNLPDALKQQLGLT